MRKTPERYRTTDADPITTPRPYDWYADALNRRYGLSRTTPQGRDEEQEAFEDGAQHLVRR